jgi:CPA2 family monovalent cation:H+ antiporter-2
VVLIVSKVGSVLTSSLLIGVDSRTALRAGLAMAHVGEFSFVVAGLGVAQGVLPPAFLGLVVAASAVTAFTTPLFMRRGKKWGDQLEESLPEGARTFHARYVSWLKALRVPLRRYRLPKNLYPLVLRSAVLTVLLLCLGPSLPWVKERFFPAESPPWVAPALEVLFLVVFLALYLLFLNTLQRLFRHVLKSGGETMDKKGQTLLKLWMFVASAASPLQWRAWWFTWAGASNALWRRWTAGWIRSWIRWSSLPPESPRTAPP